MHDDFLHYFLYFIHLTSYFITLFSNTVECVLIPSASENEIKIYYTKLWEELIA
jgi:hypothetical protein